MCWHSWNEVPSYFCQHRIGSLEQKSAIFIFYDCLIASKWSDSLKYLLSLPLFLRSHFSKTPLFSRNPKHRHWARGKVSVGPDSIKTWVKGQELWAWHLRGFEMADGMLRLTYKSTQCGYEYTLHGSYGDGRKAAECFFISRCSMVMPRSCNVIEIDIFDWDT